MKTGSKRKTNKPATTGAAQLKLRLCEAEKKAERAHVEAREAKARHKRARKAYKEARKLCKELRKQFKAVAKALKETGNKQLLTPAKPKTKPLAATSGQGPDPKSVAPTKPGVA